MCHFLRTIFKRSSFCLNERCGNSTICSGGIRKGPCQPDSFLRNGVTEVDVRTSKPIFVAAWRRAGKNHLSVFQKGFERFSQIGLVRYFELVLIGVVFAIVFLLGTFGRKAGDVELAGRVNALISFGMSIFVSLPFFF